MSAPDVKRQIGYLVKELELDWIKRTKIYCFRSTKSKSRAYARIWGLPYVWQKALKTTPSYIIEVLSEKFDDLDKDEKNKVLIHELAHIPKTFTGSLVPHYRKGKRNFHDKVKTLVAQYNRIENTK
ncbi:putative metallopeptidase [Patescibacteria group bacterium]